MRERKICGSMRDLMETGIQMDKPVVYREEEMILYEKKDSRMEF